MTSIAKRVSIVSVVSVVTIVLTVTYGGVIMNHKWYVFDIDEGLWTSLTDSGGYDSYNKALFDCSCACDDGRKMISAKRISMGYYLYERAGSSLVIVSASKLMTSPDLSAWFADVLETEAKNREGTT